MCDQFMIVLYQDSCDVKIRVIFTISLMVGWIVNVADVKGVFSHGYFEHKEEIYTNVSEAFEKFWDPEC